MPVRKTRLDREAETVSAMIAVFCKGHHRNRGRGLCAACSELADYALLRLKNCRYGINKPVCRNCKTHCYKPEYRDRIRDVMRYGGPRMLGKHPVLAVMHLLHGLREGGYG